MQRIDGVRKIAVLRANSVGDFVFCLPALDALRAEYPQAEIVYLGKPWHNEFLQGRPSPISRVVIIPVSAGVRQEEDGQVEDSRELSAFFDRMQNERFDLALQLHGGGKHSNPFVKRLGARLTAGFHTPDAEPLDISLPYSSFHNDIARCLELVQKLGAPVVSLEPTLSVTGRDMEEAGHALGSFEPPFLVLHVGAHDPRRRWPPENFAMVGDHFAKAGFRIILTAGANEVQVGGAVTAAMTMPALHLAGKLSLRGLAGLLSQAALVISNDTGPLHVANALGKRTVGLYWVGNLINFGSLYRETHLPLVSWTLKCPECGRSCIIGNLPGESPERCSHVGTFIADIPVRDVIGAAESLLSVEPREPSQKRH